MGLDIKKLRDRLELKYATIKAAAAAAGIPQPSLSRILGGNCNNITLDTLDRLAKAAHCKAGDLLT